ncbi:MAG: hypothetical protein WBB73_01835 [Candidatus Aminicenantaceae bacterium]
MADDEKKEPNGGPPAIRIDYDNPDVGDIMRQIQEGALSPTPEDELQEPEEEAPAPPTPDQSAPVYEPLLLSGPQRLLLKLTRPFAPLIKLLILPVHHELRETVHRLDYTNRRLDYLFHRMEQEMGSLGRELSRTGEAINRKADDAHQRLDKAFHNLGRTMEYTKLLHSLSHNLVVELSKQKIEEEDIKVKARILEKDFEFLRSKEKALEQRIIK